MWQDPIVEEIHKIREALAAKFQYDVQALGKFFQAQQASGTPRGGDPCPTTRAQQQLQGPTAHARPSRTTACRRRPIASAPASLQPLGAPEAQRSASIESKKLAGGRFEETTMWCNTVGCIVALTLSILAAPLAAKAQQVGKVPHLGVLFPAELPSPEEPSLVVFRQALRDLGYIEGQTVAIEYRYGLGRQESFPDLVAELVRLSGRHFGCRVRKPRLWLRSMRLRRFQSSL